ncbi:MAG: flagellar hook-associated protein FlgK, partial [Lachnospiraceae bacterium]|nr:flagellar hook-associated protein FlgK [Lachnospiraceae bacterium]
MPSTFFGLDIGYTGLSIYQNALNTTAHNITNAETEGYSRQFLGRKAGKAISISSSYGMVGTGVIGTGVDQKRDTYYDVKYRDANTLYGEYAGKSYYMNEIEDYFNEEDGEGFSTNFASMYTTFEELAKDPSSQSARRQVLNYSLAFTEYFNSLSTNLRNIQEEVNFEIKNCVDRINSIGTQIATLTKQINTIEVKGTKANDLRDERNKLIDELSELADIQVKEEDIGMKADQTSVNLTAFTVKINGRYLVNNYASSSLELVPRDIKANLNDVDGLYDITWSDGQNFEMYGNTIGGKLASLIEVRDGNNEDALNGYITASEGDTEVTMTMTNCNDIRKLNIPENGMLVIGNQEYEYKSFSVDIDENGQYSYKFQLDESKPLVTNTYDTEVPNARIGHLIDYKGLPYYLSMMNEFVRTFAKEFNAIHKTG